MTKDSKMGFLRVGLLTVGVIHGLLLFSKPLPAQTLSLFVPTLDLGLVDPDRQPIKLSYTLNRDTPEVEIRIEDFRGRVVRRFAFADLPAGEKVFEWSGQDDQGARMPDGRYRIHLEARFERGSAPETAVVDLRLADLPGPAIQPPALPPLGEAAYRIRGRLGGLWRDDPGIGSVYEARAMLDLEANYHDFSARGRFSARKLRGRDLNSDSSRLRLIRKLPGAEIRAVWRDDLGSLEDPLTLFNDFQTPRKKVGLRADWQKGIVGITLLGFESEGDVNSRENGAAGRLTVGEEEGWQGGLSFSHRRALDQWSDNDRKFTSNAFSADLKIPVHADLSLVLALAASTDDRQPDDQAVLIQGRYDNGNLRLGVGYIGLGENFAARFSDPLRQENSDVEGLTMTVDYLRPQALGRLNNLALSSRVLVSRRPSSQEIYWESDTLVRFNWGPDVTWMFNWLQFEDGPMRQLNLRANLRRKWNRQWSSGLQGAYSENTSGSTWRGVADVTLKEDTTQLKLLADAVYREIKWDPASPYGEYGLRLDADYQNWRGRLILRYHQRNIETDAGFNAYGRLAYERKWLHRYTGLVYVALGSRSALKTEERVEVGLEVRF